MIYLFLNHLTALKALSAQ